MIPWPVVLLAAVVLFIVALWLAIDRDKAEKKVQKLQVLVQQLHDAADQAGTLALHQAAVWLKSQEKEIRADAIKKSFDTNKGRITEHLLPFFPDFDYNPRDCRFLGSPVDLIVFDGLTDGSIRKVVFLEVKTGRFARLSKRERDLKEAVEFGDVTYEVKSISSASTSSTSEEASS